MSAVETHRDWNPFLPEYSGYLTVLPENWQLLHATAAIILMTMRSHTSFTEHHLPVIRDLASKESVIDGEFACYSFHSHRVRQFLFACLDWLSFLNRFFYGIYQQTGVPMLVCFSMGCVSRRLDSHPTEAQKALSTMVQTSQIKLPPAKLSMG